MNEEEEEEEGVAEDGEKIAEVKGEAGETLDQELQTPHQAKQREGKQM